MGWLPWWFALVRGVGVGVGVGACLFVTTSVEDFAFFLFGMLSQPDSRTDVCVEGQAYWFWSPGVLAFPGILRRFACQTP